MFDVMERLVFCGSYVALVTPMLATGEVDYTAMLGLVDWHLSSGSDGLVILGTTGEAASLTSYERHKIIKSIVSYVDKRIPVIVGAGAQSTHGTISLTLEAKSLGADAVLLVTPCYVKPTQKGLIEHFRAVAQQCDIPQILYNVPSRSGVDLLPEAVLELSREDNIVGIKDATANLDRLQQMLVVNKNKKEMAFFSGDDATSLEFMKLGGDGVISVAANIAPLEMKQLCDSARSKDYNIANKINISLNDLYSALFCESNPIPVKWMLYKMKRISLQLRLPLTPLDDRFHAVCLRAAIK